MSKYPNNKIYYNSIPEQRLTHSNELTIQNWNNYINQLRVQTNEMTVYIKSLTRWIDDDLHLNDKQNKLISSNAGLGISITFDEDLIISCKVDSKTICCNDNGELSISGYSSAAIGAIPFKTAEGLVWDIIPSLTDLQNFQSTLATTLNQINTAKTDADTYRTQAQVAASNASQSLTAVKNYLDNKLWFGTIEEYNDLKEIVIGRAYFIKESI